MFHEGHRDEVPRQLIPIDEETLRDRQHPIEDLFVARALDGDGEPCEISHQQVEKQLTVITHVLVKLWSEFGHGLEKLGGDLLAIRDRHALSLPDWGVKETGSASVPALVVGVPNACSPAARR